MRLSFPSVRTMRPSCLFHASSAAFTAASKSHPGISAFMFCLALSMSTGERATFTSSGSPFSTENMATPVLSRFSILTGFEKSMEKYMRWSRDHPSERL